MYPNSITKVPSPEWDHPPLRGRPRRPTPPQAQQQKRNLPSTPRQLRYHTLSYRIWKQFGALDIKQGDRPPISLSYAALPDLETVCALVIKQGIRPPILLSYAVLETGCVWSFGFKRGGVDPQSPQRCRIFFIPDLETGWLDGFKQGGRQ